jgi:hypothetical protein
MILYGAGWFSSRALRGALGGVWGDSERLERPKRLPLACVVGAGAAANDESEVSALAIVGAMLVVWLCLTRFFGRPDGDGDSFRWLKRAKDVTVKEFSKQNSW